MEKKQQLCLSILSSIIDSIFQQPALIPKLPLTSIFQHSHNSFIKMVHVHQQFINNFCGYHSIYNIIIALQIIKKAVKNQTSQIPQISYDFLNCAQFWKFKKSMERFLLEYKVKNNLQLFPWNQYYLLFGDFQRSIYNVTKLHFQRFVEAIQSSNEVVIRHGSWLFQYKNLINSQQQIKNLQQIFQQFYKFNDQTKHFIVTLVLGITNHWTSFMAHKHNGKTEFFLFDSKNLLILDFSQEQIQQVIEKNQRIQIEDGHQPFNIFQKKTWKQSMMDFQLSLRIITDCLQGFNTLQSYHINQMFLVFMKKYQDINKLKDVDQDEFFEMIKNWSHTYYHNIRSFAQKQCNWGKLLSKQNIEMLKQLKNYMVENKYKAQKNVTKHSFDTFHKVYQILQNLFIQK